jgi:hypothetical protein
MVQPILREFIHFRDADELYKQLESLDPGFRRAAVVIDVDYDEEYTFKGFQRYYSMTLEAKVDASPEVS